MEKRVKRGHPTHLINQNYLYKMMQTIPTGVERQQGTIAAIPIQIQEDPGAIQRIQT